MFQFHPTGMLYPKEAEGILVTEAVRGEGGILLNTKGERFMKRYDSHRLELSARDIVARAIYHEVQAGHGTRHGGVWLDISHKQKEYILKRLPKMYKQFKEYAHIDISKQKMEVGPTAHYSMGGLHVDHRTGSTTIRNLYAIGEVTGGVHGANRLGGNSLAEIIVFGKKTGNQVAHDIKNIIWAPLDKNLLKKKMKELHALTKTHGKNPLEVKKEIQQLMWTYAGVIRNRKGLKKAYQELQHYKKIPLVTGASLKMNQKLIAALDVKNMLPTCEMILKSALKRTESRGAHYRSDYPKTRKSWKKNILCYPALKGVKIVTKPIAKVPKKILHFIKQKRQPPTRLLE